MVVAAAVVAEFATDVAAEFAVEMTVTTLVCWGVESLIVQELLQTMAFL